MAFSYGSRFIVHLEERGRGLQWDALGFAETGSSFSFAWCCYMMLIDGALYFLLGFYIRTVFPGTADTRGRNQDVGQGGARRNRNTGVGLCGGVDKMLGCAETSPRCSLWWPREVASQNLTCRPPGRGSVACFTGGLGQMGAGEICNPYPFRKASDAGYFIATETGLKV